MNIEAPKVDTRKFSDILKLLKELAPHYTPEWSAGEKDTGAALLKIFSHMTEEVITRLNKSPHKNLVVFLDMLGIKLLPAQPARGPVTFQLAKGTEKEVLIPARTQVAADKTEEHDELSFETEKNLLATPSRLKRVINIEPFKDAIFEPPPDFLNGSGKQGQIVYKLVSSAQKGSNNFQLDHVTGLKKGDLVRIADEYAVISAISGNIATITDSLAQDYSINTKTMKVTDLTLFEGRNIQEHSIYIGHKDIFNVKSRANFMISVVHEGSGAGITPLKVSWEYWGEEEGEEGESWRTFNVIDETQGLSINGEIELIKTKNGEIKEKEINAVKSRWIRCIVREPLSVDQPRKLPVLNAITFKVKSSGEGLKPEHAFNNDIPIDANKPFTPFGKEPRMFDNFSIAHKEAFSKKGAKITLDVDVEPRGIVGPPAAIEYDDKIKVFARGTYGRLVEVEIDPAGTEEPEWRDHGFPTDTKIASESMPSALSYGSNISVFARAENGHLVERSFNGQQWQWIDYGTPKEGVGISLDPFAIYGNDTIGYGVICIFVAGADGSLYVFHRSPDKMTGEWQDIKRPNDSKCASSAYVVKVREGSAEGIELKIFVKGENGHLYELDYEARQKRAGAWTDNDLPDAASGVKVGSRPFAWASYDGLHVRVYVKGSDNNLWEFDNTTAKRWLNKEHPDSVSIDSDPSVYMFEPGGTSEKIRIFVRGSDNYLWEWDKGWTSHQAPANSKLTFSPFVLNMPKYGLHIFSASSRNSVIERISNTTKIWNEYKDPDETALTPALSWEYWNNNGWSAIKGISDGTSNLLHKGEITFMLPEDIEETEISGQKSYWIKARIIGGDYGKETFFLSQKMTSLKSARESGNVQLISTRDAIRPPVVNSLTIGYALETKQLPQRCITYNNLEYLDATTACSAEDKRFTPFVQMEEKNKTLYLGFEKAFKGGPIKIFFSAKELSYNVEKKPKMEWTHSAKDGWGQLSYLDSTEGLIRAEILELIGPQEFDARSLFGSYLNWIKGYLVEGEYEGSPVLYGIHPNTTWALQAETIKDETLGSSNGEAGQAFSFQKSPVLEGEEIRVGETVSEEERQAIISASGENAIVEVKDEKGKITGTWILWREAPDFFDSSEKDRHYIIDRATGEIQFGDGINGMMPPAGDNNIKAFLYQTGGGKQGNIKAGEIKSLKSSVAGVDKATNHAACDGGADTATLEEMLKAGPAMISHRNRAVTPEDFEWLSREASRKVAKVKCLANTNNKKRTETGWVSVVIIPDSLEDKPFPSLELRRKVQKYLEKHCAITLSHKRHVHVAGPDYVEVGASADVFVDSIDLASEVEREILRRLNAFFHPLTGGPEGMGWDFGRDVSVSDIYALLEGVDGVDHVENPRLIANGAVYSEIVEINENSLAANGTHDINIQLIKGDTYYGPAYSKY